MKVMFLVLVIAALAFSVPSRSGETVTLEGNQGTTLTASISVSTNHVHKATTWDWIDTVMYYLTEWPTLKVQEVLSRCHTQSCNH